MRPAMLAVVVAAAACGSPAASTGNRDGAAPGSDGAVAGDASAPVDAAVCTTRITYGSAWIHPANHAAQFDDVAGTVDWDGTCDADGTNSIAHLSNGFAPVFRGASACVIALDSSPACGVAAACATRVRYGSGWVPSHAATYDDLEGRVFSDEVCVDDSYAVLSNGFEPHYSGGSCPLSVRYTQCGGLYVNPVIPGDCPDPGVLRDGDRYVLSCTSGDSADAFPIYTSPDLVTWTPAGHIFPSASKPTWASGDFWAPEIHQVGSQYVAYFSALNTTGRIAIGVATAPTATGPFTDVGAPLISDPNMGLIDPDEHTTSDGTPYVLWKEDGNAQGLPTPIHSQQLSPDGLSLVGITHTLITNDQSWEGKVTEAPWLVEHGGMFYLFYSGNSYASSTYAVGVARGTTPIDMMTKQSAPILVTNSAWVGPGHCSVIDMPGGDTAIVYHAWTAGCVDQAGCGRHTMVDEIIWGSDGWPTVPMAPSVNSRPTP